jgi:uncharacterized protein RhaS with RHS repeats
LAGGLNTYTYADNNPVGSVDPLGLQTRSIPIPWPPIFIPGTPENREAAGKLDQACRDGIKILGRFQIVKISSATDASSQTEEREQLDLFSGTPTSPQGPDEDEIEAMSRSGQEIDPADRGGELTRAGRALQKHGGRPDSAFPGPSGNAQQMNQAGQRTLDGILRNPGSHVRGGAE